MVKKFLSMVCVICVSVLCLFTVLGSQVLLNSQDAAAGINLGEILLDVGDNIVSTIPGSIISAMLPGAAPVVTGVNVIGDVVDLIDGSGGGEVLVDDSGSSGISGGHSFGGGSTTAGDILPSAGVSGTTSGGGSDGGSNTSSGSGEGIDWTCDDIAKRIENGKAGAMQWFMCPAMTNMTYTADFLDRTTQKWLETETDLYSGDAVYKGWDMVRNIANVVMVVFLMIIIMSQLTGRGIDNYGIKKMLPRLIVMAIIVNLSIYICQLAVDVSNIAGTGLRNLFGSMGNTISGGGDSFDGSYIGSGILGMFTVASGAVGAIGTGFTVAGIVGLTITTFWAVLIVVVALVIVIIVAVVILFAMLGIRKILVMFCVVISPLAFVLWILPNTQNLSKKWWELFKSAIIIYPICGAVGGISVLIRAIAEKSEGVSWYAIAILMVLPYLIYFLIPMLLKQAISALGKLGGALTSMGQTIRSGGRAIGQGAMRAAQNSEWGKANQERAARRRQEVWADRTLKKIGNRDNLAKRIEDARKRANNQNLTASKRRSANRELRRLQNQALTADKATGIQNRLKTEQYAANMGGTVQLSDEVAMARAVSGREAQEYKGYFDQFDVLPTRSAKARELESAINAYNNDRTDANATRLRAAIAVADKSGMEKELLKSSTNLALSASNSNDAKVLGAFASAKSSVLLSQFGIQTGKQEAPEGKEIERTSLGQFMEMKNIIPGLNAMTALNKKGPRVLVGESDDTFEYINDMGVKRDSNGNVIEKKNLIDVNQAITAGVGANDKLAVQIAEMIRRAKTGDITALSGDILAGQSKISLEALANKAKTDQTLRTEFVNATNAIAQSPNLMGGLQKYQRELFDDIRGDNFFQNAANGVPVAGQQQTGQTGQQQQTAQPTPQPIPQPMPQSTSQPAQQTGQSAVIVPPINPPASTASNQNSGQQNNFGNNIAEALRNNANSTADVVSGIKNLRGAIENNNNSQVFEVRNTGGEPTGQIVNNQNIVNNTNNTTTNENNNLSAQFDASLRGLEANRFERIIPRGNNRRDNKSNNNNSNPDDNPSSNGESDS
ncbi:hypothetical protein IKF23_03930 [Candidatus Saccharibacteria bacterium]|nr:hypothetical protein [Candidatus Saccharibacteria bacterium]